MFNVIWWVFVNIVLPAAAATGIAMLLARRKNDKPSGAAAFEGPTAEEGRPLPVVFGKRRMTSPNAISPLLAYSVGTWEKNGVPVAFVYFVSLHIGLCQANIDGVKQIWFKEDCCWPMVGDPTIEAADNQSSATINAGTVWGGGYRQGGVAGIIDIQYGADDQTLNATLETLLGADQPAYRGFTGLILRPGFYVGTIGSFPQLSALLKRTNLLRDGSEMWYLAKANIGDDDLNPIHILYELRTSKIIGLGKSTSLIGDSFTDAADTLYSEGFGLSCIWDWAPDDIDSVHGQIEEIIDGKVYWDSTTGKFEIGLVREDYDAGSLETFDEDDFWVEMMSSDSLGRAPSRVIVRWHDKVNLQSRPAYDDDIALLARQDGSGEVVELDYSAFVCDGDLANTIAARAQRFYAAQPKRYILRTLRTMAHLNETDVIKISYEDLNIASMIVRIVAIDRGNIQNGECVIEVIEDVFGQAYTVYGSPPAAGTSKASEITGDWPHDFDDITEIVITTGPLPHIQEHLLIAEEIDTSWDPPQKEMMESLSISETIEAHLTPLPSSCAETITLSETITARMITLEAQCAETITLTDSITPEIP